MQVDTYLLRLVNRQVGRLKHCNLRFPRSPAIAEELTTDVVSHPTTPSGVDSVLPNCLGDLPLSRQG